MSLKVLLILLTLLPNLASAQDPHCVPNEEQLKYLEFLEELIAQNDIDIRETYLKEQELNFDEANNSEEIKILNLAIKLLILKQEFLLHKWNSTIEECRSTDIRA